MITIHLTDAQRDTFAVCGLIVIDGECRHCGQTPITVGVLGELTAGCCQAQKDRPEFIAPEGWRILAEPCDTCNGFGAKYWTDYPSGGTVASCGVCGWDIEMRQNRWEHVEPDRYRLQHEGRDRPFKLDHTTYPQPCPDCVGGRRVVTLTANCPRCQSDPRCEHNLESGSHGWGCTKCGLSGVGPLRWHSDGTKCENHEVTLGRFTIPALLPAYLTDVSPSSSYPGPGNCLVVAPSGVFIERPTETRNEYFTLDPLPRLGQFIARPERVAEDTGRDTRDKVQ
jgi:hypothetical protein